MPVRLDYTPSDVIPVFQGHGDIIIVIIIIIIIIICLLLSL